MYLDQFCFSPYGLSYGNTVVLFSLCHRTKYEVRDKQHQETKTTLEKEKKSLNDELTSTINELTKVQPLSKNVR